MTKKFILGFSTIILLLQLLFISYINYINYIDLQIITSNSLISDKSVSFILRKDKIKSLHELSKLIEQYPGTNLFSQLCNFSYLKVWGIYGDCGLNSNVNSFIEGKFLEKDDFFKKEFKAVAGKSILNSDNCFTDKNGKPYFKFIDNNYEVIGVISTDITSMLDNTVFINLDSVNIQFLNKFVIDGKDSRTINNAVNSIKEKYNIDIINENNNFIERYIFNDTDERTLNVFVIIFISILLITLSIFTLCCYNEEINIKRIIGVNFKKILFDLFKSIFILILANTVLFLSIYAIIYCNILHKIHLNFYYFNVILFSGTVFAIEFLIIYLYVFITNKFFCRNGV